jgi:DNA ligase-associated metallophosphoesterase
LTDAAYERTAGTETAAARNLEVAGVGMEPDVTGALWIAGERTLVVSDLHFEKGSAFAARGVHLPPYDTRSTLALLEEVCARYRPERVISLGDSFHDGGARERMDEADLGRVRALAAACDWTWIVGNHDPAPPEDLGGRVAETVETGPLLFRHEPGPWPAPGEIAGHLHPAACVVVRGRRLRRRCFVADGARLVMPAFGAYTGGLDVLSAPFGRLFEGRRFDAWMIGRDRVYPVAGRRLR